MLRLIVFLPTFSKFTVIKLFIDIKNGKNVAQSEKGDYRVSRIESIAKSEFNLEKTKWTSDKVKEEDFLNYQDILFSHINSMAHIGKTAIFNLNEKVVHGANLLRFRANSKKILPKFALYIFKSNKFINEVKSFANQAVNQVSINTQNLKSLRIPVPSIDVQNQIVDELEKYEAIIEGNKNIILKFEQKINNLINNIWSK